LLPPPVNAETRSSRAGLLQRTLSIVILLPAFLAIVMAGPVWLFAALVVLVGAAAQWEFTGMLERAGVTTYRVVGLLAGVVLTASFAAADSERLAFTAVVLAVLAVSLWPSRAHRRAWEPVAGTLLGIGYVNWLLGYAVSLRELPS